MRHLRWNRLLKFTRSVYNRTFFYQTLFLHELRKNMKRIIITGAAGFIGFHLALQLKARGDFVIGVDNFNSY